MNLLLILISLFSISQAQLKWYNHPELDWKTLETEHFKIHFHQGTERSAREAAEVAEYVYEPITDLYDFKVPEQLKKYNPFSISVLKETNIDKVVSEIKFILKKSLNTNTDVFITRERHRIDLNNCILSLQNFKNKNINEDFDKATEDLRVAVRTLGKVVGKVDVEEILSSIFNDFCIGK